jgi:cell wall-associated NlpC family hydrolase
MTSPFLLATRPKKAAALQQDPNASPAQVNQQTRADTPPPDPRQKWQQFRDQAIDTQEKRSAADVISPVANTIPMSDYMDRFGPIKAIGEISAAGQVASSQAQRQAAAARMAAQLAAQQSAALNSAYQNSANVQVGGGMSDSGGAGWGSGGNQGIANVLRAAGFEENLIPTFIGIAMAESGGRPDAINDRNANGSTDRGLFQINSIHQGNAWYPTNPNDPLQSAKAARAIYLSQGLKAWTVYKTGAYAKFVPSVAPPKQVTAVPSMAGGVVSTGNGSLRMQAVQKSLVVLNLPYVWGGDSLSSGVDCSGLVQQVYKQIGIAMPRQARAQATTGTRVASVNQLQPGDLVAFKWAGGYAGPNTVSHIAIYAGNGEIIEAYGGSHGRRRKLTNSQQDQGAIYIHTRYPGE